MMYCHFSRSLGHSVCTTVFILLLCHRGLLLSHANPVLTSEVDAMVYLRRYGYMSGSGDNSASLVSQEVISTAIAQFQKFAGLPTTGLLDNQTLTMMNMPRCGVPDIITPSEAQGRRKRYALQGSKWRVSNLKYRISKYPKRIKDRIKIEKEIAKAFKIWSEVTPLQFVETKSGRVHIDIRFEEREHGDGVSFDGRGGALAHAFFPQYGGNTHFDDEEKWTIDQYSGTSIFQVAAHELGHAFGLSHSMVQEAVMVSFYKGYDPNFKLHEDDIRGIQAIYGKSVTIHPTDLDPGQNPATPEDGAMNICQESSVDAATRTEDGSTYVFKGEYYWEVLQNGISDGYPRRISDDWDGHPGYLDAALTWANGKTFFFQKDKYWRYRNKKRDPGYPKSLSVGFEGIPSNVDAAFVWSGNGKTYFFKGSSYWRFDSRNDPPVSAKYPQPISNWEGLPDFIDAALQWNNQKTYFFKGNSYYRFNDRTFAVDTGAPTYPRSTSIWWFDCRPQSVQRSSVAKDAKLPVYIGPQTTQAANFENAANFPDDNTASTDDRPQSFLDYENSSARACLSQFFYVTLVTLAALTYGGYYTI